MSSVMTENLEIYWAAVSYIVRFANFMIMTYFIIRFVKPFVGQKKCAIATGISYFLCMFILYIIPFEMAFSFAYTVGGVVMCAVMYWMDRRNLKQKIFLAVLIMLFRWIVHGISILPRSLLFDYVINTGTMVGKPLLQFGIYAVTEAVYLCLKILIMYFLINFTVRIYENKKDDMTNHEFILMLIPVLLAMAGYYIFSYFEKVYEQDMNYYLRAVHVEYEWLLALYQIISYGTILVMILIFQRIKKSQREEKENAILEEQIINIKSHISEVERLYSDMRSLRHDMGNHMMTLENLYRKNEMKEAENYIKNLSSSLDEFKFRIKSGNPVTDVILEEMRKRAEEKGIAFESEFFFPANTNINAFDVSVILNNALVNAVEGADGEKREIHILSYRKKNAYLIEIKNSFIGKLVIDEDTGLPETSKKNKQEHGYGLINIRKVAQKYHGDVAVQLENGRFILTVMLMME